jgi:HlyD family secretion protein
MNITAKLEILSPEGKTMMQTLSFISPLASPRIRAAAGIFAGLFLWVTLSACGNGDEFANPSGTLEATEVDLSPLLTAKVLQVRTDEGDTVAEGDTLLVLDTDLLQKKRAQTAAQNDVLAAQTREAQQALRQSERKLELASTTLKRSKTLHEQGSVTQQQVDDLSAQRDLASSQVEAARDRLTQLDAQRRELKASLAVMDRQIADGVILAPIDGTILVRVAEPGEVGRTGALALRMADLSQLELRVYLEEPELNRVKLGQSLPVLVDALGGKELRGRVSWISSQAEFTPKNAQTAKARAQLVYAVKLQVDNPDGSLHIGMPAAVRLAATSGK